MDEMQTVTYIDAAGRLVEVRKDTARRNPIVLFLECRVLQPDGTPYDDLWFPVTDEHLLNLNLYYRATLDAICHDCH